MYCNKCGNEVPENAKFCNKCGAQLIDAPSNIEKIENASGNRDGKERKGLFSKKTQTCARCGKTFEARLNKDYCPECELVFGEKLAENEGYINAAENVYKEFHCFDEEFYDKIRIHDEDIWSRFPSTRGFASDIDLTVAVSNYKSMSTSEGASILDRASGCTAMAIESNIMNNQFIMPGQYPGTIVDLRDIFAVGYAGIATDKDYGIEGLISLFLTNDPFVPIFASMGLYDVKLLRMKSKAGREALQGIYSFQFPNLQYPVQELKELKKQIKRECMVRGDIDLEIALEHLDDAIHQIGTYKMRSLDAVAPPKSWEKAQSQGYIDCKPALDIMDKNRKSKAFWDEAACLAENGGIL